MIASVVEASDIPAIVVLAEPGSGEALRSCAVRVLLLIRS